MLLRATVAFVIVVAIAQTQTPPPVQKPAPTPTPASTPTPPPEPTLEMSWEFALRAAAEGSGIPWIVPGDGRVFVADPRSTTTAHDTKDGHVLWISEDATVLSPVIVGASLLLIGETDVRVVSQSTGQPVFRAQFDGRPVLAFAAGDRMGVVLEGAIEAWNLKGEPAWRASFAGAPITNAVTAGSLLIFGTDEPALMAFDLAAGTVAWKIPLPTRPGLLSTTDERVYFGGADGLLYSYRTSGEPKHAWRTGRRPRTVGQPFIKGRSVYFAFLDNSVREFGADGGSQRWDQAMDSRPLTGPFRLMDSLGVALTNGRVVELSPKTGKPVGPESGTRTGGVRLLTVAPTPDGSRVYTITIAKEESRTLTAWTRRATTPSR